MQKYENFFYYISVAFIACVLGLFFGGLYGILTNNKKAEVYEKILMPIPIENVDSGNINNNVDKYEKSNGKG
jgi:uncharacterized protein with PQ loop repeat